MSLTELLASALAGYRVALFLTDDIGPWGVADKLRQLLHADRTMNLDKTGRHTGRALVDPTGWEKLWSCMRCMTWWTTLAMVAIWQLTPLPVELLAVWGGAQVAHGMGRDDL